MDSKQDALNEKLKFKPECMATAIGSMPHKDAKVAAKILFENCSGPVWPQLPKISFRENMYLQYTEGMPSFFIDETKEKGIFKTGQTEDLEKFYRKYLDNDLDYFKITETFSKGFYAALDLIKNLPTEPVLIKGQVTGPISFGLGVKEENGKAILYNDTYADVVVKALAMKAKWQEVQFKRIALNAQTMIFFDEPYLVSFGSAFVSLNEADVADKLNECFQALNGLKGIHVCGGTDWAFIMRLNLDVIHFDAYDYFESLSLYPKELDSFLNRGGMIGWGITPHTGKVVNESADSLLQNLEIKINELSQKGLDKQLILERSFVAPSCGTGTMTEDAAQKVLELTGKLSKKLKEKYF